MTNLGMKAIAGACIIALVGALLRLGVGHTHLDDIKRTVAKGLEDRDSRVQTLECYVVTKRFFGPASRLNDEHGKADLGVTSFYAVDRLRDRWLVERRFYYAPPGEPLQTRSHTVDLWSEGLTAYKVIGRAWQTATTPNTGIVPAMLQDMFFLSRADPVALTRQNGPTLTEEDVDGARCFRIDDEATTPSPEYSVRVIAWVDPDKGFAVRRWAWLYFRNGHLWSDTIGHAYNFREYKEKAWLPRRTKIVQCRHDDQSRRSWEELMINETFEAGEPQVGYTRANINNPVDIPVLGKENPIPSYEARLVDDDPDEAQRQKSLLAALRAGPGDPSAFVEPLPQSSNTADQ